MLGLLRSCMRVQVLGRVGVARHKADWQWRNNKARELFIQLPAPQLLRAAERLRSPLRLLHVLIAGHPLGGKRKEKKEKNMVVAVVRFT